MSNLVVMTASDYSDGSVEQRSFDSLDTQLKIVGCKTEEEIISAAQGAIGILITYTPIGKAAFDALDDLRIIVRCGIGVDNIDLSSAKEHGIKVCNVPDYCLDEVADHAFALLLALERRLLVQNQDIRQGVWKGISRVKEIRGLQNSVLGIVGFGQIGRKLALRAKPFGIKLVAYDPYVTQADADKYDVTLLPLPELLHVSDFVSLHPPLTAENKHIINSVTLTKMKSSAYLINTSRGPLVDRVALLDALREGRIAGAGLDVVEDDLAGTLELSKLDNVINTPHTAWYSQNSFNLLRQKSAEEIARFLRGEPLLHPLV